MSEQKQNIYEFGDFQLDIGKGVLSREKINRLICNGKLLKRSVF
jgi:hypothetical protein